MLHVFENINGVRGDVVVVVVIQIRFEAVRVEKCVEPMFGKLLGEHVDYFHVVLRVCQLIVRVERGNVRAW